MHPSGHHGRDTFGDACDADDDNDGVADAQDNCPIVANTDQADDDRDGLGNACDATFNAGTLVDLIEENSSGAITVLRAVNPPGVNGLIAKLSGAGGVPKKVADNEAVRAAKDATQTIPIVMGHLGHNRAEGDTSWDDWMARWR
jgi:hypothetical protein